MTGAQPAGTEDDLCAMWDFRRQGWTFRSGGPGSGLFKSTDGGATGPKSRRQRKGIARETLWPRGAGGCAFEAASRVCQHRGGKRARFTAPTMAAQTWTKLDASNYMVWRPFYFGNLIVDPKDENKIFKPDLILLFSNEWRQELQRGFRRSTRRLS